MLANISGCFYQALFLMGRKKIDYVFPSMIQAGRALHHVGLLTSENLQMDGDRDKGKGGDEKGVL